MSKPRVRLATREPTSRMLRACGFRSQPSSLGRLTGRWLRWVPGRLLLTTFPVVGYL